MDNKTPENTLIKGLITLSLGGTYTVKTDNGDIYCKPRGIFRKAGYLSPVAGDFAEISLTEDGEGIIESLLPRKNTVLRPAAANIDLLVLVCSTTEPETNLSVLDKFLAFAVKNEMPTLIAVTKNDLKDNKELKEIYSAVTDVLEVDYRSPETVLAVRDFIKGKTVMFAGNSGVGKTTLLNHLCPGLSAATGEISKKLGRGRHTTRCVQLFPFEGGYIADTPGFSTFTLDLYDDFKREELAELFVDFKPFLGKCDFSDCMHVKEIGCRIKEAVSAGKIAQSRYDNYVLICTERGHK
jgi:ribosome biogenesis GTPase